MKAITVVPHQPQTAQLEDIPEPDARGGSVLVQAIAVGFAAPISRSWRGNTVERPRARRDLCSGMNRWAVSRPGPSSRFRRAISSSVLSGVPTRSLPELCGGRVGHVPQRPIYRARDQRDRRLHVRALADRARRRDADRSSLGLLGVLLEPMTVVTKAWEQVLAVGQRSFWEPRTSTCAPAPGRLVFLLPSSDFSTGSRSTFSTGPYRGPSRIRFVPWERPTTLAPSRA